MLAATVLSTCTLPTDPDYSAYTGTNLIPNGQFDNGLWVADDGDSSPATDPALGTDPYLTFQAVTFGSANYPDDATLRSGLSGSQAIYRLETRNLLVGGDFEGGGNPFSVNSPITESGTSFYTNPTDGNFDQRGNWARLAVATIATSGIDIQSDLTPTTFTTAYNYTINFRCRLPDAYLYYFGFDSESSTTGTAGRTTVTTIDYDNNAKLKYRFPFTTPVNSRESLLIPTGGKRYFRINPLIMPSGTTARQFLGTMDDIQIIRADLDTAIRYNINWAESGRPNLQRGGTYTFKVFVRRDRTPATSGYTTPAGGIPVNNRFAADFLSVSIHENTSATNSHGQTVVFSRELGTDSTWNNAGSADAWENWTEVSASFTNLLNYSSSSNPALQIAVSATNFSSASLRSAGSVLISNPRLYWKP